MFLRYTVYLSLFVQIATGIVDVLALQLKVPSRVMILRQALILELIVQVIEAIFYIWLVFAIQRATINITPKRYYDWFLTTPTMLFTLMVYMDYLKKNKTDKKEEEQTLQEFSKKYKTIIAMVVFLNALMLLFGYMGEMRILPIKTSVALGFIPFLFYYAIIYHYFISEEGKKVYFYFFIVWSIYGFAALLPYNPKNMLYNILDLFAKNFFGIYLSYLLYTNRVPKN